MKLSSVVLILLTSILAACTSVSPPVIQPVAPAFSHPATQQAWLASLHSWEAEGSFAARREDGAWTGSFEWQQWSKNTYQIHFYGPFGAGNTYLSGNPEGVVWKDNEGTTRALTPNELVWLKTGFQFPVSYLYDWILGRPAPGVVKKQQKDAEGRMMSFEQAGWNVIYLKYQPAGQGELPAMIRLTHDDIQLKLVIRNWKINV